MGSVVLSGRAYEVYPTVADSKEVKEYLQNRGLDSQQVRGQLSNLLL